MKNSLHLFALCALMACAGSENPSSSAGDPSSSPSVTERPQLADNTFGADVNPTGNPIGGGAGYSRIVTQIDILVKTRQELLDALAQAKSGQIVYVDDSAELNMTGQQKIIIPGGVTLASGRGKDGSRGARIFSTALETFPLFQAGGPDVRLTGLRLEGPDPERRTEQMAQLYSEGAYYSIPNSRGIQSTHPRLEVDNCEVYAWSHAGVYLMAGASHGHVHHNHMHHNQRSGLGYGVVLDRSNAVIEANLFDWCRHHIAGTGRPGTSYEARYNLVLENANSHSFDMHGGADRDDGTDIAGDTILIHHNTFRATDVFAVVIRGRPTDIADIYNNWFLHQDAAKAVRQTNATENVRHYKNQYTADRVVKD